MKNIHFVDLYSQYLTIKNEIDTSISRVILNSSYIGGDEVSLFESNFSNKLGIDNCLGVANGTDAIYIALKALGIGHGDEVITTSHSWISTSEAISQTGAKPVFVDVDEYYCIDVTLVEGKINSKTKAIIPVHLFGQAANMSVIMKIAKKFNLFVIEDCAQAHFAKWDNKFVGTFGNAATFSFYPGKNLGSYGDAGAIVTNDHDLYLKMRMFANHGALKKHQHFIEGINSRLDGLQAAILDVKLKHIDDWTDKRRKVAGWYNDLLSNISCVKRPLLNPDSTHVYHLYVIQVENRDKIIEELNNLGIQTAIHYPVPLPLMPAYDYIKIDKNEIPKVIYNKNRILSLPIYPELSFSDVKFICDSISQIISKINF